MKEKLENITVKDVIVFSFSILLAVIGYFINQRLASIDESLKEFSAFQREQIGNIKVIEGSIKLLQAKDEELEKKIEAIK
jgi:hypothetical protein